MSRICHGVHGQCQKRDITQKKNTEMLMLKSTSSARASPAGEFRQHTNTNLLLFSDLRLSFSPLEHGHRFAPYLIDYSVEEALESRSVRTIGYGYGEYKTSISSAVKIGVLVYPSWKQSKWTSACVLSTHYPLPRKTDIPLILALTLLPTLLLPEKLLPPVCTLPLLGSYHHHLIPVAEQSIH